jgi:hypothetical protein
MMHLGAEPLNPQTETTQRWILNTDLVTRLVGGQVFVLMPDSTMHILENESAVFLFNLLQGGPDAGQNVEELSAALLKTFEISGERAVADVMGFVRDLHDLGILSLRP